MAHALEGFRSGSGAADVPMFVLGVGADDEEVVGSGDAAVAGPSRKDEDIAGVDGDRFAAFSTEDEVCVTLGEAKHLVRCGMVMVKIVDTVAPLRRPSIDGEEALHCGGKIVVCRHGVAVDQNRQRAIGHPAVRFEMELLRRHCGGTFRFRCQGFAASDAGSQNARGEVSAVDWFHVCSMLSAVSGVGTQDCP